MVDMGPGWSLSAGRAERGSGAGTTTKIRKRFSRTPH
jgi:hypothetical protein